MSRRSRRGALSFRASDRVTGVEIRLFGLGRTDCRVASLLAMTECVGDGVLDVPLRAVPVLPCRGGRLCPPWMTAAPRRAGPMCPAAPSAERCHSEPVTDVTGVGIRLFGLGRTDCRVASLLAMTECVGDAVLAVPLRAVPVLPCRGGRLCPPRVTGSGIRPSAYGCMAAAVAGSR